jgi:hypothetical protein
MKSFFNSCLIISFWGLCITNHLSAQDVIPATGGDANGTGGSFSYTLGQIVYTSVSGTDGSVNQGVQQPYETLVLTENEFSKDIDLVCKVYPNPVSDKLILKLDPEKFKKTSWNLFDINGKLLQSGLALDSETEILLENLPSGSYIFNVIQSKNTIKSFKIIKK